jgi:hypothetical protein
MHGGAPNSPPIQPRTDKSQQKSALPTPKDDAAMRRDDTMQALRKIGRDVTQRNTEVRRGR